MLRNVYVDTIQDTYIDATCSKGCKSSFTNRKFDEYKVYHGPDTISHNVTKLITYHRLRFSHTLQSESNQISMHIFKLFIAIDYE